MARHRNVQSYPPPLFVAELEAPNVRPPPARPSTASASAASPTPQIPVDTAADPSRNRQRRYSVQANPWPFYLDDAARSRHSLVAEFARRGVAPRDGGTRPMTANPWPYHGQDDKYIVDEEEERARARARARSNSEAPPPTPMSQVEPVNGLGITFHAAQSSEASRHSPDTVRFGQESSRSTTSLHSNSSSNIPPTPGYKPYLPGSTRPRAPSHTSLTTPSPLSSRVHRPTAFQYRPYRPSPESPLAPRSPPEQTPANHPILPYPTDSEPLAAYVPQVPEPRQPSLSSGSSAGRRSTQPSMIVPRKERPLSGSSFARSHFLSTASATESSHSSFTDMPPAKSFATNTTGWTSRTSISTTDAPQQKPWSLLCVLPRIWRRHRAQHVNSDPTPLYRQRPASPLQPSPYMYSSQEPSLQPSPLRADSPYQPPAHQMGPPNTTHSVPSAHQQDYFPAIPLQGPHPQSQYPMRHEMPALPPRPATAYPPAAPAGFRGSAPSTASFPLPPNMHHVPSPQNLQQRPPSARLLSGSSRKKWRDKVDQALENKLAPALQPQTDTRPRSASGRRYSSPMPVRTPPPPGQEYYPYGIRGDPFGTDQYRGSG